MKTFFLLTIISAFSISFVGCGGTPESIPEDDEKRAVQENDPEYEKEMMGEGEGGE